MAVWTSAWLNGSAASDDVLDALQAWGELQEVTAGDEHAAERFDLPLPDDRPVGPALLLACLRRAGARTGALVLPAPGDVRGLGGPGPFQVAALHAEEAVVLPSAAMGLVPAEVAEGVLRWSVFALPAPPNLEYVPIGEAEHRMAEAVRAAAATLVSLDVARHRPGVRTEIDAALRARPRDPWPHGMPGRSLRVLERAAEVAAIVQAAMGDPDGGTVSASAARARVAALRPLSDAVRAARYAAVAEAVRLFSDQAGRH
ncbi:hypothetical protein M8C13_17295 [Crossiella sp. SN42]|uniref:hypothetical protein n=1 Tax=Crossiella sp. SN42 TaxID=2944808 RepID=UPI00207D0C0C|nr:hypothetical protein [Crossiella sp. SN42]MCO1577516.1 hypothetical protein [Crossiella sp. SN42]